LYHDWYFVHLCGVACLVFEPQFHPKTIAINFIFGAVVILSFANPFHNPSNGSKWTVCFELVSLAFGTAISVYLPDDFSGITKLTKVNLQKVCIIFFGLSLFVFSVLHFVYSAYISTLIPIWIPFHLFWAYFFGCAFLATSLSIISNKYSRISTFALSLMFLLWVFVLHLPRVIVNPIEAEITSLFVALGMSGVSMLFSFYSRRSAQFSVHAIL